MKIGPYARKDLFCEPFSITVFTMSDIPTLATLPVGRWGQISAVTSGGPSIVRLQELGLVCGTPIRVVRRAPLGEPIEIEVRGSRLAMRNHEAAHFGVGEGTK